MLQGEPGQGRRALRSAGPMIAFPDTIRVLRAKFPMFPGAFDPPLPVMRVSLDRAQFRASGQSAPRGSGHGPLGTRYEHDRPLLSDGREAQLEARCVVTECLLNGDAPAEV